MKIIHLSDLHLQSKGYHIQNIYRIFSHISKHHAMEPVVITGDLTDSCTKPQLMAMAKWLSDLRQTNAVFAVPGNHDYAWKGNIHRDKGRENWREIIEEPLGYSLKHGIAVRTFSEQTGIPKYIYGSESAFSDIRFWLIDSGDPTDKEKSARGYISKNLITRINDLKDLPGTPVVKKQIFALHHHPFTEDWFTALKGAERFMKAIAGTCDILLFGHDHHLAIWENKDFIPLIVASHKSTKPISGNVLGYLVIDIGLDPSQKNVVHMETVF